MSGGTFDVSKVVREILSVMVSFEQNPKIRSVRNMDGYLEDILEKSFLVPADLSG